MRKNLSRIIIITLILILTCCLGFYLKDTFMRKNKPNEIVYETEIKTYGYNIRSGVNDNQKKAFQELKSNLESETIDFKEYASSVAKLFIFDFYTLKDKLTNQDVGGIQFVATKITDNFKLKASNTIYKYVESNIYGDRKQELPVVLDVTVTDLKENDDGYEISLSWTYEEDLGYDTSKKIVITKIENKLYIIEIEDVK